MKEEDRKKTTLDRGQGLLKWLEGVKNLEIEDIDFVIDRLEFTLPTQIRPDKNNYNSQS